MMPKRAETGIRVSLLYTLPASALESIFCALRSPIRSQERVWELRVSQIVDGEQDGCFIADVRCDSAASHSVAASSSLALVSFAGQVELAAGRAVLELCAIGWRRKRRTSAALAASVKSLAKAAPGQFGWSCD